jgi:DNA-binding transcriptional ArsR family regulator
MAHDVNIARVAAQIGHPVRAAMLDQLLSSQERTAGQLAAVAQVSRSVASQHLRLLEHGGLVTVTAVGRHRWYRLAGEEVAEALEALARIAPAQRPTSLRQVTKVKALWAARTCYDHLAGRLGVALADTLLRRGVVVTRPHDGAWVLSDVGVRWLEAAGLELPTLPRSRRPLIRPCLDWSERRPHLAGLLGSALLDRLLACQWLVRIPGQRAVRMNPDVSVHPAWDPLLADVLIEYARA